MTTYQVALSFEDGVTRFIKCDDDETVADASYRQRINIPLDCRDGACGTCKSFCESGTYDGGDYIEDALTDEEAEKGFILTCQARPMSDMVVQIPATSDIAKTSAATFEGTITSITKHSPTMISFSVSIPNRSELIFLPGQYVNILVPGSTETRSYSFSSAPGDEELSFLIKIVDGGLMSNWLSTTAEVGQKITFTGPFGSFFLRDLQRKTLLLAGGSGLAPIMSMLGKLRDSGGTDKELRLLFGVNVDQDLAHLDTIENFKSLLPTLNPDHLVADPKSTAVHKGYVTNLITPEDLADGDCDVYLCGPPAMVEAVRTHFETIGSSPVSFYFEKFSGNTAKTAAPANAPASSESVEVAAPATGPVSRQQYEIGEEHPSILSSDAIFDARMGLELAVMELTIGRLSSQQLTGYRLVAENSDVGVDGDRFTDAPKFVEANAVFHAYPFGLTGNEHLLQAFERLGVKGHMNDVLSKATYCHPDIVHEHFAIVEAFEQGDRNRAVELIKVHADHSKETMHRAMRETGMLDG